MEKPAVAVVVVEAADNRAGNRAEIHNNHSRNMDNRKNNNKEV